MQVYLPIAEVSLNALVPLFLGTGVGILSGMFGVGGGFLLTPVLIFFGVPAAVAVASGAATLVGSSVSGGIAHWRRGNVDVRMGGVLLAGGVAGSYGGVVLFGLMRDLGQIDVMISGLYVVILGVVGSMQLVESLRAMIRVRGGDTAAGDRRRGAGAGTGWVGRLPFPIHFPRSNLSVSPILPFVLGMLVGMLSALMGVGGGFIMVPVLIYLLGMQTRIVIGTSLFQIIFVTACTTFFQAVENRAVDALLASLLLVGGVVGAHLGTWLGGRLKAEQLRILLALLVLGVGLRMAADLLMPPDEIYSVTTLVAGP